jgi:hypothetical protein
MTPEDQKIFETMKQLIATTPMHHWGGNDYQFGQRVESMQWYQAVFEAATTLDN